MCIKNENNGIKVLFIQINIVKQTVGTDFNLTLLLSL